MPSLRLNADYIKNTLVPAYSKIAEKTEKGPDPELSFHKSTGKSTYSFGVYQFDVGKNGLALKFLDDLNVFDPAELKDLAGDKKLDKKEEERLSEKLSAAINDPSHPENLAAYQKLNSTWAGKLVKNLQDTLDALEAINLSAAKQIYASEALQLALMDYENQFPGMISIPGGVGAPSMFKWLSGEATRTGDGKPLQRPANQELTIPVIRKFIENTAEGIARPRGILGREKNFDTGLSSIQLVKPVVDEINDTLSKQVSAVKQMPWYQGDSSSVIQDALGNVIGNASYIPDRFTVKKADPVSMTFAADGSQTDTWSEINGTAGSYSYNVSSNDLNAQWTRELPGPNGEIAGGLTIDPRQLTLTQTYPSGGKSVRWSNEDGTGGLTFYYPNGVMASTRTYNADGSYVERSSNISGGGGGIFEFGSDGSQAGIMFYESGPVSKKWHIGSGGAWTVIAYDEQGKVIPSESGSGGGGVVNQDQVLSAPDGTVTENKRAASGYLTSRVIARSDGSTEVDEFFQDVTDLQRWKSQTISNVDGSGIRRTWYADGELSTDRETNADGSYSYKSYDGRGYLTSDQWKKSDGTSGTDTYAQDGEASGTLTYQDGGRGTYTINADGIKKETRNYLDGSYSVVESDGFGVVDNALYAANGQLISDDQSDPSPVFCLGGGHVTVSRSAVPQLRFGSGISYRDVQFQQQGNSLLVTYSPSDSVLLQTDGGQDYGYPSVEFADGSMASYGSDLMGAATTTIQGGAIAGSYAFGPGAGHVTLTAGNSGSASIHASAGLTASAVTLSRDGSNNVVLTLDGGSDTLTLQSADGSFDPPAQQLIFADGTTWDLTQLASQIPIVGSAGDDYLDGSQSTIGAIFNGGAGNDTLSGGAGDDTYQFGFGSGQDTVIDGAGSNTVQMQVGVTPADVTLSRDGDNNLVLTLAGGQDALTLRNSYASFDPAVQQVVFADGTTWNLTQLASKIPIMGTVGNDSIDGSLSIGSNIFTGGTENDTLIGGAGNDVYQFGFGSGQDVVADSQGNNTVQMSATVMPADVTLSRDDSNGLVLALNGAQDTLTLSNWYAGAGSSTSTVVFADGTTWDLTQVASALPAPVTAAIWQDFAARIQADSETPREIRLGVGDQILQADTNSMVVGGGGNSQIYDAGVAFVSNGNNYISNATIAYGGAGNDTIVGGQTVIAGTGNDDIYAGTGAATITILANTAGKDLIGGNADPSSYLDTYYTAQGIGDWEQRYERGGLYGMPDYGFVIEYQLRQILSANPDGPFKTVQQIVDAGEARYITPLPVLLQVPGVPLVPSPYYATRGTLTIQLPSANDFEALLPYSDILPSHRLVFGPGISRDQLQLSWGTADASMSGTGDASVHTTLNISWGTSGELQVLIPHFDDPIGSGISEFDFSDGTSVKLAELIAQAPPAPTFDPQLKSFGFEAGSGQQILGSEYANVQFASLTPDQVSVSRDGADLVLTVVGSSDAVRLPGLYSNKYAYSKLDVSFSDGTHWNEGALAAQGLVIDGSAGDQTLTGLSGFANTLIAGPNDTLIGGGSGLDTYVFNAGAGTVHIQDGTGTGTIQFGLGITPDQISLGLGSLMLRVGSNGDTIHIDGYDPQNALGSSGISTFLFADGSKLTLQQLLARGFDIYGTTGDEVLSGSSVNDRIYAGAGNDTLIGGRGNDTLVAGAGDDTFEFAPGDGRDVIDESAKSGVVTGTDTIRFAAGVASADLQFSRVGSDVVIANRSTGDALTVANMQAIGRIQYLDGSYDTYQETGQAGSSMTHHAADGSVIGVTQQTFDGLGDSTTSEYDASGNKLGDSWTKANGTHGNDIFHPDGSSNGTSYSVDGSYSSYTNDGQGDAITSQYDANGVKLSDSWTKADGTYGTDSFSAGGSSTGVAYNVDGSYSDYTNDGHGDVVTNQYDVNGVKLSDSWTKADGTHGDDRFDADGSAGGSAFNADGSFSAYTRDAFANVYRNYYDASSNWIGFGDLRADGSSSGAMYSADGSYSSYSTDPSGNSWVGYFDPNNKLLTYSVTNIDSVGTSTTADFSSDGTKLSADWLKKDGSSGNDVFNADGSSSGTSLNPDGSFSSYTQDASGNRTTLNFGVDGSEIGYSETSTDASGSVTTVNFDPTGKKLGSSVFSNSGGAYEITTEYDANDTKLSDSLYDPSSGFRGNHVFNPNGSVNYTWSYPDGSHGVEFDAADGSGNSTSTRSDGSYSTDVWQADGSDNAVTHNVDGSYSTSTTDSLGNTRQVNFGADATKVSDSWTNSDGTSGNDTFNADGSIEVQVDYTYADGSTYSTDTVTQVDGSYQQAWSKGDGSSGTTDYVAATGEVSGSNATAGAGYSYTYDNTKLAGGASESKVSYAYTDGSTYSTDTVSQADGSYQQAWSKSDGSTGSTNYVAATGEVSGSNATTGAGYSYTYDNTKLAGGASESKVNYTYTNGSTYATDTVSDADGSYQQAWSKDDGSHGDTNYVAATGEVSGDMAQAGAGYSYTYDNTKLASGAAESKVTYTYTDGSTYATDTVSETDGSYQQAWSKGDGSSGTTDYAAGTGEVSGSNATAGAGYSYVYDNTKLASGAAESKVTYTYADGSTYSTDTVSETDGSYQQAWSKGDGSIGTTDYVAATGEVSGSNATAGAGYSYTYDNTKLASGAAESKVTYTYADGSTYSTDTVSQVDGSYQQSWSKGDGSTGSTNYVAATGEVSGSNATAGAGYSYTYDNNKLTGGASESKVIYTYVDGSTYSTDTVSQADGSYQQAWSKSDGAAGSVDVAGGAVQGDSWLTATGQQGVDAAGNQLLLGSGGADAIAAGNGDAIITGGAGNDVISTGSGADIVAFNLGDGRDTVQSAAPASDTLSLGGQFAYSDLALEHVGNDLVLDVGSNDSITLKDWYANPANQNFVTLQVIADSMSDYAPGSSDVLRNASVQTFDFKTLVSEFDTAQSANPSANPWSLTFGLLDAHLASSNDAALGGELAYGYGKNGTLAGTDVLLAQSTLSTANFGSTAQAIQPAVATSGLAKIA